VSWGYLDEGLFVILENRLLMAGLNDSAKESIKAVDFCRYVMLLEQWIDSIPCHHHLLLQYY